MRNSTDSVSIDIDLIPLGGKVIELFYSEKIIQLNNVV